ncbi:MAG TPA: nitrogen regulation protein NR(II) [Steroidobacteraceae bacterium]|nr:nitrogen regulation protein NR(II) [Steroidobacteraceae bacterium]
MAPEHSLPSPLSHFDSADLLNALSTGIILLDAQLCPIYANVAAQDLLAFSLNQSRGRPFGDHLLETNGLNSILRRSIETGEAFADRELVLNLRSMPREPRIVDVTITPLEGEVTGTHLLLELTDTTARQRISRENEMLVRLDSSRMMLRQLAHEIKNPLGGLRGAAQLLERELPDEHLKEYTNVIISEADRLSALVASMTGPNRPMHKTQLNIHELCEHVYHLVRGEAPAGVVIDRDYDPSLPSANFDRNQLIQALLNVARNAMQAVGDHGHITFRTRAYSNVSIAGRRHRLAAGIQVEDDGPGVPAALRASIFYPLVTGRSTGTGLGLAVAQDLVTRHGGLIEFESEPGRTVFKLMLPLEEAV